MNEYDEYGTPRNSRRGKPATLYDWIRNVIVPIVLGILGLGAITIIFAPQLIFNSPVREGEDDPPLSDTPNIETTVPIQILTSTFVPTIGFTIIPTLTNEPEADTPATSVALPMPVSVARGNPFNYLVSDEWGWLCSGDFDVAQSNEQTKSLYDNDSKTDSLIIVQPSSTLKLYAIGAAYCEPYFPDTKQIIENRFVTNILTDTLNCENGCTSVQIVELDENGSIITDEQRR